MLLLNDYFQSGKDFYKNGKVNFSTSQSFQRVYHYLYRLTTLDGSTAVKTGQLILTRQNRYFKDQAALQLF